MDGDILAYRAAATAEKTYYLVGNDSGSNEENGGWVFKEYDNAKDAKEAAKPHEVINTQIWTRKEVKDVEFAKMIADQMIQSFSETFPKYTMTVYVSGDNNFRDLVWKTKRYKGNRVSEKPKHLNAVLQYLQTKYNAIVSVGEADDAIAAEHYRYVPNARSVVASNDKDLDQLAGWHYDFIKKEVYFVTQKDADIFLFQQILSGDQVDNIPGLPGIGPVKARAILGEPTSTASLFEAAVNGYKSLGFDELYFSEQANLIYIRRDHRSFEEYFQHKGNVNAS